MKKIYLDNGATTMAAKGVVEVMLPYFSDKFGNASSLHDFGQEVKNNLEQAREMIAKSINAETSEIIFTSGGTESDNLAIKGVALAKGKGHIITSKIEHPAVINSCKQLEKQGFTVTYLHVDEFGLVNPKDVETAIEENTILISIMYANNEIGTIEPIKEIGEIARKHNVLFHTDAVQSYTKVLLDVNENNLDLVSLSSHKIHGPKGVGALYLRKGVKITPLSAGGAQEFRLRAGTENIPGIIGFAKAVELDEKFEFIKGLRDKLIKGLLEIPDTKLNGHAEKRLVNNVNISFKFVEGESLLLMLNDAGIAVSTGSACSSKSLEPSHVLTAIGLKPETAHGSIRFTLSRYNTEEEIDYTIKTVKITVDKLREMSPLKGDF